MEHSTSVLSGAQSVFSASPWALMGTTDLNHHELLQGKPLSGAYRDFLNDIDEFIQNEGNGLDKHTNALLVNIKDKVNQCSNLANEIDKAVIIRSLNRGTPAVLGGLVLDIAYQVQKSMMNLQPGSSLILPLGFKNPRGGHATVVSVYVATRDLCLK